MTNCNLSPAKCHRFTLVELLVVIAIISILAGMLMPVLENATSSAKQISCLNTVKQHGFLFFSYSDNYANYIPAKNAYPSWYFWYEALLDELYDLDGSYTKSHEDLFECPADHDFLFTFTDISYGINYRISNADGNKYQKLQSIKKPSRFILEGDTAPNSSGYAMTSQVQFIPSLRLGTTHNSGCNILYVDGHAGWSYYDGVSTFGTIDMWWVSGAWGVWNGIN